MTEWFNVHAWKVRVLTDTVEIREKNIKGD